MFSSEMCLSSPGDLLLQVLKELRNSKQLCDVTIKSNSEIIYAHSSVLAASSPFLLNLLMERIASDWSVYRPLEINLNDIIDSKDNCIMCILKVVDFIYSGRINVHPCHLSHLIYLSTLFELQTLSDFCKKFSLNRVEQKEENACRTVLKKVNKASTRIETIVPLAPDDKDIVLSAFQNSQMLGNNEESLKSTTVSKVKTNSQKSSAVEHKDVLSSIQGNIPHLFNDDEEYQQSEPVFSGNSNCIENITATQTPNDMSVMVSENKETDIDNTKKRKDAISSPLPCQTKNNDVCNSVNSGQCSVSSGEAPLEGSHIANVADVQNCTMCKLKFNSLKMFEYHKKVWHTKQFTCLYCDYKTHKLSYMVYHLVNMEHEGNYCSVCLFEAADGKSLKNHVLSHKKDYPFKCYYCEKMFKVRCSWLSHITIHMNEYKCKVCKKLFSTKEYLKAHLESHDEDTQQKPFKCNTCEFTAPYKSVLLRHNLKHVKENIAKLYYCPVSPCPFSTQYIQNLKEHTILHENEKHFTCELCSLKFSLEKNLKRHTSTVHNSDNLYSCLRCNYKCVRIDKMKKHCQVQHTEDKEALRHINIQQDEKKMVKRNTTNKTQLNQHGGLKNVNNAKTSKQSKPVIENSYFTSDPKQGSISEEVTTANMKKTYILSETTGEFNIISENGDGQVPVASVTSTNVLTIGNFREGTGSVTLNETTGLLTLNNINSESTGVVFLNESTGELSYINLEQDALNMDIDRTACKSVTDVQTQLNEFTGEMFTVSSEKSITDFNDDDSLFDPFDMDIGNEDSCDGFDDLDGILFDPMDVDGNDHLNLIISKSKSESLKCTPHLNEATGELSFDNFESHENTNELWPTNCNLHEQVDNLQEENDDAYRLLLNEVTGEFS